MTKIGEIKGVDSHGARVAVSGTDYAMTVKQRKQMLAAVRAVCNLHSLHCMNYRLRFRNRDNVLQDLEEQNEITKSRLAVINDDAAPFFKEGDHVDVLDCGSYCPGRIAGHAWSASGTWFYRVQFSGKSAKTVHK